MSRTFQGPLLAHANALFLGLLCASTAFGSSVVDAIASPPTTYDVIVDGAQPLHPTVHAVLPPGTTTIRFPGPSVGIEPDEWLKHVDELSAADRRGQDLPLQAIDAGEWRIVGDPVGPIQVTYRVDLEFALEPWPAGNEHSAYFEADSLYLMGEALFLTGDVEGPARIDFELPPGWGSTTAWAPLGDSHAYVAPSTASLLGNCLVLGRHSVLVLERDGFRYMLALIGRAAAAERHAAAWIEKQLDSYIRLFGGAPKGAYLQAMFLSDQEDGEAHLDSSGFRTSLEPSEKNRILWLNTLSHELFHRWLSSKTLIAPVEYAPSQWFSEGFTEYYANLTLLRNGAFTLDEFLRKMETNLGLYLYYGRSPAFRASVAEAGEDKTLNRLAVYNGGWTAAFCLDGMIRAETANRRSLDDFMRAMFRLYGTTGTPYRTEDLPRVIRGATGVDVAPFFERYVTGRHLMPIDRCLETAGFVAGSKGYAGEIYIWPAEAMTDKQQHVNEGLLTGKRDSGAKR